MRHYSFINRSGAFSAPRLPLLQVHMPVEVVTYVPSNVTHTTRLFDAVPHQHSLPLGVHIYSYIGDLKLPADPVWPRTIEYLFRYPVGTRLATSGCMQVSALPGTTQDRTTRRRYME